MTTRADVCTEARRWVGTPFAHQGRTRGLGCDCRGLVGGVAVALGLVGADWWDQFDLHFGGYPEQPPAGLMAKACDTFMQRTAVPEPGDVVVLAFHLDPQHMGIITPYPHGGLAIVHALHVRGVREHRLAHTLAAKITQAYRLPGVA